MKVVCSRLRGKLKCCRSTSSMIFLALVHLLQSPLVIICKTYISSCIHPLTGNKDITLKSYCHIQFYADLLAILNVNQKFGQT